MMFARIPASKASKIIPRFLQLGLINRNVKITKGERYRLVPILEGKKDVVAKMGYDFMDGPVQIICRTSPQERILADLSDLPENVLNNLPRKWEYIGRIIIIRLDRSAEPYKQRIGKVYANHLRMDTVCVDRKGVSGEFRKPSMEIIYGTQTEGTRLENGILYRLDVTKVMFSSGNMDERRRMKFLDCTGETIVDMFAGIGYFTLPIAKFANPYRVIACEKNPESFKFLKKNIELNDVSDIVIPVLGDNRNLDIKDATVDRILMGYVKNTSDFLSKALSMIRPGGMIHYHDTFKVREYQKVVNEIFDKYCPGRYEIKNIREVKSFAPSVSHYVVDVKIS